SKQYRQYAAESFEGEPPAPERSEQFRLATNFADDIAIVGMSAVLPGAPDLGVFWRNLIEGKSSIADAPPERWSGAENSRKMKIRGGFVDSPERFDPLFFKISPRE